MSDLETARVWKFSSAKGSALLVHLSIANQSNDDGLCFGYNLNHFGRMARVKDRHLSRIFAWLIANNEIAVIRRPGFSNIFVNLAGMDQEHKEARQTLAITYLRIQGPLTLATGVPLTPTTGVPLTPTTGVPLTPTTGVPLTPTTGVVRENGNHYKGNKIEEEDSSSLLRKQMMIEYGIQPNDAIHLATQVTGEQIVGWITYIESLPASKILTCKSNYLYTMLGEGKISPLPMVKAQHKPRKAAPPSNELTEGERASLRERMEETDRQRRERRYENGTTTH